jgi:hypothetical protein
MEVFSFVKQSNAMISHAMVRPEEETPDLPPLSHGPFRYGTDCEFINTMESLHRVYTEHAQVWKLFRDREAATFPEAWLKLHAKDKHWNEAFCDLNEPLEKIEERMRRISKLDAHSMAPVANSLRVWKMNPLACGTMMYNMTLAQSVV